MKTKVAVFFSMVLCINMVLSAMQIHNYAKGKKDDIKTESGIFNEDYLFLGNELTFSGQAEDLLFLGKRLTFNGKTTLGLIALCEKLIFSGSAGNGIIAGGKDIIINGAITSNSYVGCKSFILNKDAKIDGNLFIGTGKITLDGALKGNLYTGAGEVVINSEIQGDVTAYAGRIVFGPHGKIAGNLTYSTKEKLRDEDLAKIAGSVTLDESFNRDKDWDSFVSFLKSIGPLIAIGMFLSFVIVGSALLFLPVFKKLDAPQSAKTFFKTSLWGLIPVLMYPALVVLSIILIIPIPFAIVLMLAFIPLFFIAFIIGNTLVGKFIVTQFKWHIQKRHYQFLIGSLAGVILTAIPVINCLSFLFVSALGWGVYISFLFDKNIASVSAE
jgi:hypothetical protein